MSEQTAAATSSRARRGPPTSRLLGIGLLVLAGYGLLVHPPLVRIERDQVGVRSNQLTGGVSLLGEGYALLLPGLHQLRRHRTAEQAHVLRSSEGGADALRSSEKIAIGADIHVHYAIDPQQLAIRSAQLPADLKDELVAPLLQEIVARQFAARGVLAIVAEQQLQLREAIESELRLGLAAKGLLLRKLRIEDIALPALLADRIYSPERSVSATGPAPLQTSEGLAIGAEINIRYALDPLQLAMFSSRPANALDGQLIEALVQGVIYQQFARYTVRDILTGKRQELQDAISAELGPLMSKDGFVLRSITMGNIDLPADYRAGMDRLLAAELATRQMEHTLELKARQVQETELQAQADKVRRDKAAEAAANEQVIAAKAQEEAMRHVLPFKQKQLEQRRLEAEADKATRISTAEAAAEARRIEAAGEADSRRRLADADAYRIEQLGKLSTTQLERDGAVIQRYPLLIQKTMADKLSDKISVIIAPPPGDGGFVGNTLLGATAGNHPDRKP